ncbi:class I SAM-dependent methyltransferase [Rhodocaloribacter litoris]|uniref:class I SAM-dependent methyltransferase n=1 Tax=Rhodocaloribacter litoris TaxID=2558931 RepID=UPI00141F3479|nr:class I SAM-dependent methyltransferase [Rhodocaloribacter litoris]QXD13688.1 class I SAM-dependent methyltransferase [Rhodocaloribacter litoris]
MKGEEHNVAKHYDGWAFQFELERLEEYCPVEYAITCRYLERYVPNTSVVADVGAGAGHYASFLAKRGCTIHLIDVSVRLLEAARERVEQAGLGHQVKTVVQTSATDLSCLGDESCDAVLMLGPLYHLRELSERRQAVREGYRVLKVGGVLFAAGINRLAYLRDLFREKPEESIRRKAFHEEYLRNGKLDPEHAPPLGYAHLTTVSEFRELLAGYFEELALVGVESFTSVWQSQLNNLSDNEREAWLDLVERTGRTIEGISQSDHFLFIGKKRQQLTNNVKEVDKR